MFDAILLLTEPTEQAVLGPLLRQHNSALSIISLTTAQEFQKLGAMLLGRSRLIAFATPVIVPAPVLLALGYGAFNFHPGPPTYPGWAPAHFALYDGATEFGTTFHAMAEKVDTGTILDARFFSIANGTTVIELEKLAYSCLVRQFVDWADLLANQPAPLTPRQAASWNEHKNSRRSYRALCDIPLDISKEDLERRMRAFGDNHFGIVPTVTLHGHEFRATPNPTETDPVSD